MGIKEGRLGGEERPVSHQRRRGKLPRKARQWRHTGVVMDVSAGAVETVESLLKRDEGVGNAGVVGETQEAKRVSRRHWHAAQAHLPPVGVPPREPKRVWVA